MNTSATIKDIILKNQEIDSIRLRGWVRTKRDSKSGITFIEINDGTCVSNLQIVADSALIGQVLTQKIITGASIQVEGSLVKSMGSKQCLEIQARKVDLIGCSDAGFPMQKKRHTNDYLRTIPHLRARSDRFGAIFRIRNTLSYAIHKYFQERQFMWIHTPIITTSDCESAGDMFQVTTLDLANVPKTAETTDYLDDYFGKPVFLTVSGQLALEAFSSCFGGVYTFGPTFRAEDSNTSRHLSEFWMIEPEMAFADLQDDISLSFDFLQFLYKHVLEINTEDMEYCDNKICEGIFKSIERDASQRYEVMEYTEVIKRLLSSGKTYKYPVYWGCNLQSEHERYITEELIGDPVAIINYPKEIKPFYMTLNDDEKTVAAMDILVPRIGELIGGSQREHRYDVLESRIHTSGLKVEEYKWYLDLRRWGSVPHAGFGIGFERLVQYVTGVSNIRDTIPFPRTRRQAIL